MRDSLNHSHHVGLFGASRAERAAERFADFLGTVRFVVLSSALILAWILVNVLAAGLRWDPYPFILLNLAFSAFAFYTGALVIISQKASAKRDAARELADIAHREELHQELRDLILSDTALTREAHAMVEGVAAQHPPF